MMFSTSQPPPDTADNVDGCPLIVMQDKKEDVEFMLKACYGDRLALLV
jgi:hypothetical protein